MSLLPTEKVKAISKSPSKMIIYSKPKCGKTTAISMLEGALLIDLEKGSNFLDALKIDIKTIAEQQGKSPLSVLKEVGQEIIAAGKPYKYIVIDTITALEDMCGPFALQLYKNTPMGKSFAGDNVLTLPNGAGYLYLREAMEKMVAFLNTLADRVIYLGHIKVKSIEKNGKEVSAADLDLTGKIKSQLSADVDAIGMLYRDGNKCILSFNTKDEVICGARPSHLKNKEIVLTEYDEKNDSVVANWDKIYID